MLETFDKKFIFIKVKLVKPEEISQSNNHLLHIIINNLSVILNAVLVFGFDKYHIDQSIRVKSVTIELLPKIMCALRNLLGPI